MKPITVIRSGDLSRNAAVRISTSDGTASAGLDYKPKTETLNFEPGVSALDFDIKILYDTEKEEIESFKVTLGPQDPISGIFGKITTANVYIKDSGLDNTKFNNKVQQNNELVTVPNTPKVTGLFAANQFLPALPFLTSLPHLLRNKIVTNKDEKYVTMVPSGYPLLCIHVCI